MTVTLVDDTYVLVEVTAGAVVVVKTTDVEKLNGVKTIDPC